MLKDKVHKVFSKLSNYDITFETFDKLTVKIFLEEKNSRDKDLCHVLSDLDNCWSINVVKMEDNQVNNLVKNELLNNRLLEKDFLKIKEIDLVLDKSKLGLKHNEIYFRDLSNLITISYLKLPIIDTIFNHDYDLESVIVFKNIDNNSIINLPNKTVSDKQEYRNIIYNCSGYENITDWLNYLSIESLLRYITKQNSEEIIIEGNKEVTIAEQDIKKCTLSEVNIESLQKINDQFNESDTNIFEKKNFLKKVMTVYLTDDSDFSELIKKIDKIQKDFEKSYNDFINNEIESYFNNKNKIIEEIIKTSSKINDENNKMVTQIFSVLLALLATHFFYFIRSGLISESLFNLLVIGFITLYMMIFYFSNKSSIRYYEDFINDYFDIVGSVYEINSSENELKSKFMDPSLNRFKSTFRFIFVILIIILTIYVIVMFGVIGILLQILGAVIFYEIITIYKI